MTEETIKRFIKEAHDNAVEKGFYDLCDCNEGYGYTCSLCDNETGVVQNKNIGELLMLIVSELGEALEADRKNHYCHTSTLENYLSWNVGCGGDKNRYFENCIKNSFEDEISDVFIRVFDFCGYVGFNIGELHPELIFHNIKNTGELLLCVVDNISSIKKGDYMHIVFSLNFLLKMCNDMNIPIEKHIEAKMAYNRTREHKHGKKY